MKNYSCLLFFCLSDTVSAEAIDEFMDLQIHTTTHIPYPFFGKGLSYFDESRPPNISYKHLFKNVNYANYLENNNGARILVNGALNKEYVRSPKRARRIILKQIEYVNTFAAEHSEDFVVAKTPAAVRHYIQNTDKTVIIHSIEGGRALIHSADDALFWADQGVAFITLVHLVDSEYGDAAILPDVITNLINWKGSLSKKDNGLTTSGVQAIIWLANAGIMTDLTHMSDQTRKDALMLMEEKGIPPLSTHDGFKPIQNHPRGISEEDVLLFYRNNGLISLPISGISLQPHHPYERIEHQLAALDEHCSGSIDSYKFTYLSLKEFIANNVTEWHSSGVTHVTDLNEEEIVDFAIGFQSDFNGWVNHSRPRYGKDGCYELKTNIAYEQIEIAGLAHPGLMMDYWNLLEEEGVDLSPIRRASEKFVQNWEYMIENKASF